MGKLFKKILKNSYGNDPFKIFALIHEHVKYKHKDNLEICKEIMFSPISYLDIEDIISDRANASTEDLEKVRELSSLLTVSYGNLINGYKDKTTDIRKMIGKSLTQLAQDNKSEGIIYKLTPLAFGSKSTFKNEHFKIIISEILSNDKLFTTDIRSSNYLEVCERSSTLKDIIDKVYNIYTKFGIPAVVENGMSRDQTPFEFFKNNIGAPIYFTIFGFVCGLNSTFLTRERPFRNMFAAVSGGDYMAENVKYRLLYMLTNGEIDYSDKESELIKDIYDILNDKLDGQKIKKVSEQLDINYGWLIGRMVERKEGEKPEAVMELYKKIKELDCTHFLQ